ncbi:MAG: hypothetical protein ACQGVK_11560 [Myxococcota bacterium]
MAQQSDSGLTLSSLLVLAALGLFAWQSAPLQSARPGSDEPPTHEQWPDDEIPARLWQDPIHAAELHRERLRKRGAGTRDADSKQDPLPVQIAREEKKGEVVVLLVPLTPGSYAEIEERRRRRRYAILAALGDSGFVPRSAETLGLHSLTSKCGKESSESCTLELPYEWYEFEARTARVPGQGEGAAHEAGDREAKAPEKSVLLLWLDEIWLGEKPFENLERLVDELHVEIAKLPAARRASTKLRWVMLGPSQSKTLRAMVRRRDDGKPHIEKLSSHGLAAFEIYSPVATVETCDLDSSLECGDDSLQKASLLGPRFSQPCRGATPADAEVGGAFRLCFLRTIRSDRALIDALAEELARRRSLKPNDTVVVLSEWDTYFGRSLPRALDASLKDRFSSNAEKGSLLRALHGWLRRQLRKDAEEGESPGSPTLLRYTYERGIDGLVEGEPPPETGAGPGKKGEGSEGDAALVRRPFGTGQIDYLRRLARAIVRADEKARLGKGRGIRAVAVLGSDVFDKLLVLRALRDQLPGAVWITTDLDANLLHPDEFRFARNLIVASSFDLAPSSTLRSSAPPFRDSYQTSAWVATRLAVDPEFAGKYLSQPSCLPESANGPAALASVQQRDVSRSIPPLLFEVGRSGVVRLPPEKTDDEPEHEACGEEVVPALTHEPGRPLGAYALGALLMAALGIATLHQMRPRSGLIVIALSVVVGVAGALAAVAWWGLPGGEPISLTAGVSIWPSIGIRVITILVTIHLIRRLLRRLEENEHELGHRFFGEKAVAPDPGLELRELARRIGLRELGQKVRSPAAWKRLWRRVRPPAWLGGSLLLLGYLVGVMLVLRTQTFPTSERVVLQMLLLGVAIAVWWVFIYGKTRFQLHFRSVNEWVGDIREATAGQLWSDYRTIGATSSRVLRAAATGLLYFTFGSTLFALLGSPGSPGRGRLVQGLDGFTIGVSVLLMIFLLFLVVDAIRLCIGWIDKLMDEDLSWQETTVNGVARTLDLPPRQAACWVRVNLIGERTAEVGRLVYYPLIVILLMLLARSTYFDGFAFPLALALVVGLNFTIVLVAAAVLNAAARDARDTCIKRMREVSAATQGARGPVPNVAKRETLDGVIEKLEQIDVGAFRRISNQPLVRAAVLLATGLGVTWGEYAALLR